MDLLKRLILPSILLLLALGLWNSHEFQQIAAGVAIFLFGMLSLEQGFRAFSGGLLEKALHYSTNRLWKSLSFGIITTSLMQSSSLVSILAISFLSAGLINLFMGLGIIFGANLGTTTGAWLIAAFGLKIKLASYAMPMLVFGVALMFQDKKSIKGIGQVLAGIGFLFLGIHHMKEGFATFQQGVDLSLYQGQGWSGQLLYIAIGLVATVIMQSSHATLVLILTALGAGHIAYLDALALAIGANVGTTITALLGSISANTAGKQLAIGHLLFNLITGALAFLLLPQLLLLVEGCARLIGLANGDFTLRLAIFHTLFNLLGILVMLPLMSRLVKLLQSWLPPQQVSIKQPKYLNDAALSSAKGAYKVAQQESSRLYRFSRDTVIRGIGWSSAEFRQQRLPEAISAQHEITHHDIQHAYDIRLKQLHGAITRFISLARDGAGNKRSEQLRQLSVACFHMIEAVKDTKHMQSNMLRYCDGDNRHLAMAYQQLREEIARTVLNLDHAQKKFEQDQDYDELQLELEHQQLLLQRRHEAYDNDIDHMIRQQQITPTMATSLMNDKEYAFRIGKKLTKAIRSLEGVNVNPQLSLEDSELDALNQKLKSNRTEGGCDETDQTP
ncbi:Na/Pi cotransporter family protein [Bacterioplanoides sp.]|uniref:Na/Pi cotransporter family protein n=1 Tax=Bacterioplanoides sp. TaxID=2066072 RepID=UPI003B5C6B91